MLDTKLPPQALDLEKAVLGALFMDYRALADVIDILDPSDFYDPRHVAIYEAFQAVESQGQNPDLLTVANELQAKGRLNEHLSPLYLSVLTDRVASTANSEVHARIIKQKSLRRAVIRLSDQAIKDAYDDEVDTFELIERMESALSGSFEAIAEAEAVSMKDAVDDFERMYEEAQIQMAEGKPKGVTSGFKSVDDLTGGWQNGDLIIVGGRPGMGKTALALVFAVNAARAGHPVVFFSHEMPINQLIERVLASESDSYYGKIKKGQMDMAELHARCGNALKVMRSLPIYIIDKAGMKISEIRSMVKRLKREKGIQLAVGDYLQLVESTGYNRENEVSKISSGLKRIAKDNDLPFIELSQLNRGVESRGGDKRPSLADLRDSGSLEQDADQVIFPYRPFYYDITEDANGMPTENLMLLDWAKHRSGRCEEIAMHCDLSKMQIREMGQREEDRPDWIEMRPQVDF